MSGQFHLELICRPEGRQSLWISNAFRQEMDPAGFVGQITVERENGQLERGAFYRVGRSLELQADVGPIPDQVWVTVDGRLGTMAKFEAVRFFWDFRRGMAVPKGLDSMVPTPRSNPITAAKIQLGRDLFFEPDLSLDQTVSCASCHKEEYAFADTTPRSKGINGRLGRRNTPTVLNAAYHKRLFWDGRSNSLEDQAQRPILDHAEMGIEDEGMLINRLKDKYADRVEQVFNKPLSLSTIAMALATYERSLFSGDSDFDRYEAGNRNALSSSALRGRTLFFGKAGCGHCHIPPLFTDYEFHNLGVGWDGAKFTDSGRLEVTKDKKHLGQFRTPTLRDVTLTAPYMHDGSIKDLAGVMKFYNEGAVHNPMLDSAIQPLGLSESQLDDLVAFLRALEGRRASIDAKSQANDKAKEKLK